MSCVRDGSSCRTIGGHYPQTDHRYAIAWLTIIFASYGYRAPKNAIVVSMLFLSALLISGSLYLVLDMDIPFKEPDSDLL